MGNCPDSPAPSQHLQCALCLTQTQTEKPSTQQHTVNLNWLLLDSCSTVSSIKNKDFLVDIKPCKRRDEMRVHTNGGYQDYDKYGTFKFFPFNMFYNPISMANILALKMLQTFSRSQWIQMGYGLIRIGVCDAGAHIKGYHYQIHKVRKLF